MTVGFYYLDLLTHTVCCMEQVKIFFQAHLEWSIQKLNCSHYYRKGVSSFSEMIYEIMIAITYSLTPWV